MKKKVLSFFFFRLNLFSLSPLPPTLPLPLSLSFPLSHLRIAQRN